MKLLIILGLSLMCLNTSIYAEQPHWSTSFATPNAEHQSFPNSDWSSSFRSPQSKQEIKQSIPPRKDLLTGGQNDTPPEGDLLTGGHNDSSHEEDLLTGGQND